MTCDITWHEPGVVWCSMTSPDITLVLSDAQWHCLTPPWCCLMFCDIAWHHKVFSDICDNAWRHPGIAWCPMISLDVRLVSSDVAWYCLTSPWCCLTSRDIAWLRLLQHMLWRLFRTISLRFRRDVAYQIILRCHGYARCTRAPDCITTSKNGARWHCHAQVDLQSLSTCIVVMLQS